MTTITTDACACGAADRLDDLAAQNARVIAKLDALLGFAGTIAGALVSARVPFVKFPPELLRTFSTMAHWPDGT